MSDPRMIPADEARETLREVQEQKVNPPWSNALVGDLAHTVVEQAQTIKTLGRLLAGAKEAAKEKAETIQTLSRLLAGAEEAAKERAAQIESLKLALANERKAHTEAREASFPNRRKHED